MALQQGDQGGQDATLGNEGSKHPLQQVGLYVCNLHFKVGLHVCNLHFKVSFDPGELGFEIGFDV